MTALRVGEALLVGCVLASLGRCVAPRALTAAPRFEPPATDTSHEPGSTQAREFIGEVRLGYGLDVDGKVPPSLGAKRFVEGAPIHLSLWNVTDVPAGSSVRVAVRDAMDRIVWSDGKAAPRGASYVSFDIGRTLARGNYRADVIVDQEVRSRAGFEVFGRKIR